MSVMVKMFNHIPTGNLRWNSSGVSLVPSRWIWMVLSKRFLFNSFGSHGLNLSELSIVVVHPARADPVCSIHRRRIAEFRCQVARSVSTSGDFGIGEIPQSVARGASSVDVPTINTRDATRHVHAIAGLSAPWGPAAATIS